MGATVSTLHARSPLKLHHVIDGLKTNYNALKSDTVFSVFLAGSGVSLSLLLAHQFRDLKLRSSGSNQASGRPAIVVKGSDVHTTGFGQGKVIEVRAEDDICTVELPWTLAGGVHALAFVPRSTLTPVVVRKKRKKRRAPLDNLFWRRFRSILRVCVPGAHSYEARLLLVQFGLLVLRALMTVRIFRLNTMFLTQAISRASWRHWARWLVNMGGWSAIGTLCNSSLKYVEQLCGLRFRKRLTSHLHSLYMKNNGFYRLSPGGVDPSNPDSDQPIQHVDQRIADDVRTFSDKLAHLYGHSFKPILEFSMIMGSTVSDLGAWRPVALFLWLGVFERALRAVSPDIATMITKEQSAEGAFRHAHSRLQHNAEAVAFLHGAKAEESILNKSFNALYRLRAWHAIKRIGKELANQLFKFQGILVGGVFVHIPFLLRADMAPADRIAAFRACEVLMLKSGNAFTEILLLGKSLQDIAGYARRIGELMEALGNRKDKNGKIEYKSPPAEGDGDDIQFSKVTVGAPEPGGRVRTLVRNLDLRVRPGTNVLVTGPNGCGKTSLFRVLAGLWAPAAGEVHRPHDFIMWLPQNPYLVTGTLRDQVTYPHFLGGGGAADAETDKEIKKCLHIVGLSKLVSRSPLGLDQVSAEWANELSGGERERVAFARLFFHKPRFAVLDEATSAINAQGEMELYKRLVETKCTVFSIAHRLALRRFHQLELEFAGDGSGNYQLYSLQTDNSGDVAKTLITKGQEGGESKQS